MTGSLRLLGDHKRINNAASVWYLHIFSPRGATVESNIGDVTSFRSRL